MKVLDTFPLVRKRADTASVRLALSPLHEHRSARSAKLESARPGSGETSGREEGSVLVYVDESRERAKETERERERGWEKTSTSIHQPSILREVTSSARANGAAFLSVRANGSLNREGCDRGIQMKL